MSQNSAVAETAQSDVSALRKAEERFQRLINTSHEGIWEVDTEGRTILTNDRLEKILGYSTSEIQRLTPFQLLHPEDKDRFAAGWARRMRGETTTGEWRLRRKDGSYNWVSASGSPVFDEKGRVVGALAMITDVADKKLAHDEVVRLNAELEQRVAERTAQLESANKELEAFCYSVSHDLRAPLRTIRGFSDVLMEQYTPQLDARGQDFLRRTAEAAMQMERLIEDLLKLSRVTRGEIQKNEIDLSVVVGEIAAELKRTEPGRTVEFTIAPNLRVTGDERLLRVALDNLIRNAWKFTGKRSAARIEFGRMNGDSSPFFVRDNGAGFDMAYAGKLFGVFQRLHSGREFSGSGVGLAIVQRVIVRHGGRVWADAKPDAGATFYFTLPPATDASK